MRLTGSFHTIVTHGESGTAFSSVSGRSTSAGATLTAVHLPSTYSVRRPQSASPRSVPATPPPDRRAIAAGVTGSRPSAGPRGRPAAPVAGGFRLDVRRLPQ